MSGKVFLKALAVVIVLLANSDVFAYNVLAVKSSDVAPYNEAVEGFRRTCGCRVTEVSLSDLDPNQLGHEASDVRADIIFAVGVDALSQSLALNKLPVIYSMVLSPRLPAEPSRPVAGVSMYISPEKYIGAMLELFPSAKKVGLVYGRGTLESFVREAESVAHRRGLEFVKTQVERPAEVFPAVDAFKNRIDILWMVPDATVVNSDTFKHMLNFSYSNSVPVFTFSRKYVELGAAAGLHIQPAGMGAQAGEIATRVLHSKEAYSLLRVDVKSALLVVNEKILAKLGTTVNNDVIRRAVNVR